MPPCQVKGGPHRLNCVLVCHIALWLSLWTLLPAISSSNLHGTQIIYFFIIFMFTYCNINVSKCRTFSLFSLCAYVCVNTNIIENSFCGSIPVAGLAKVGILLVIYWHFLWCMHRQNSSDTCTAVLWLLMPLKIKFKVKPSYWEIFIISATVGCFEYFLKQIMKQIQGPVRARTLISKTLYNQFMTRNQC